MVADIPAYTVPGGGKVSMTQPFPPYSGEMFLQQEQRSLSFLRGAHLDSSVGARRHADTLLRWSPWACGTSLILFSAFLAVLSRRFGPEVAGTEQPILLLVAAQLAAGVVFLGAAWLAWKRMPGGFPAWWIAAVGLTMRVVLLPSTPILEDDFYRYLWDGALTAHGVNPYRLSPEEVMQGAERVPDAVRKLAEASGTVIERINYPDVRTIYPPVAQAAFALAHRIRPWSLVSWRLVLLASDVVTFLLLVRILRACALPAAWALIYLWNPLLVREVANAGHMDAVVLPFVTGAVLYAIRRRTVGAAALLALSVGAKLWPVLLLPFVLRPLVREPRKLAAALVVFGAVTALLALPILQGRLDASSGFLAYPRAWQCNDALFKLFVLAAKGLLAVAGKPLWHAQAAARVLVAVSLVAIVFASLRRPIPDGIALCDRALTTVAAAFLLSPAPFPWYYAWLAPFVAVRPRGSLLVLGVLLAVYDARYFFLARGTESFFDTWLVWLQYAPVLVLIVYEARRPAAAAGTGNRKVVCS